MKKHIISIISISALIILCNFLPFIPGSYDGLAVTLSFMTQIFSMIGLLIVPLALIWLWSEMRKRKSHTKFHKNTKHFYTATWMTLGLITLMVSFGALMNNHLSFGIIFLALCFYALTKSYIHFRINDNYENVKFNPIPIYLITIPIIVAAVRFTFIGSAVQFSRDYTIGKSEPLIAAIEAHYTTFGNYPVSLQALHTDILPGIMGVRQYHYEPNGAAYNLYFKQFSDELDVEEIVMYNKFDEHAFAAHSLDILEYTGEELTLRRGDRRRYNLSKPHWIYFKLD